MKYNINQFLLCEVSNNISSCSVKIATINVVGSKNITSEYCYQPMVELKTSETEFLKKELRFD